MSAHHIILILKAQPSFQWEYGRVKNLYACLEHCPKRAIIGIHRRITTYFMAGKTGPKPVNNLSVVNGYSLPELCRLHTNDCVKLLAEIVRGESDEGIPLDLRYQDRIRAAETLLNRGYGRPLDFATMRDLETNNSRRTIDMTNEELAEMIQAELH